MHAQIELDVHPNLSAPVPCRLRELLHHLRRVERNGEVGLFRQRQQTRELRAPDRRIGQQDVAAYLGHDFGLERRRTGEAHGAAADLLGGDAGRLVGLDVGTERKAWPLVYAAIRSRLRSRRSRSTSGTGVSSASAPLER